jgi:hypothetical protein
MPLSAILWHRNIARACDRVCGSRVRIVDRWRAASDDRAVAPARKTVVHYRDGRILKGYSNNFVPHREVFQLAAADSPEAEVVEVWAPDLKAVFFVKDLVGNPRQVDGSEFDPDRPVVGRKVRVKFQDGEQLVGTTDSHDPRRKGFFLVPADERSNIEDCYVVIAATQEITFL